MAFYRLELPEGAEWAFFPDLSDALNGRSSSFLRPVTPRHCTALQDLIKVLKMPNVE